ncbi:recombinase family protein [Pseudalkalibacillus sp. Hm43]|uniref:recombinase family protein n=1 Tax=Pseudalkalibacillus sp. Hm43 TaxID=3450742 RepID=UPI003F443BED
MKNDITASYVRVSTLKATQKDSPEHQRMVCEEKAIKENLNIIYTYEDRSSGTNILGRSEIQRMIKDAENKKFNTLIFASISRFSRDQLDALNLKRKLVDALGIRLISIEENYDSKIDQGEMKFTLFSMMAQQQAEQISLSTRRGKRQSAKRGNFTGSFAPYGYTKKKTDSSKTLVINEKAEIVQRIFHLYVHQNMGEKSIVKCLNNEGIPSPKDGLWGISSINRILTNEAYTGRNVYNKFAVVKVYDDLSNMTNRKKVQKLNSKELWNRNEEKNWDPIIDDQLFEAAQEIRRRRSGGKRGGPRQKVNVFGGFIFCGSCNSSMVTMKSKNGKNLKDGKEYRYLICSKRRRLGEKGCDNNNYIPYYDFRDSVIEEVAQKLKSRIDIDKELEKTKIQQGEANHILNNKEKTRIESSLEENRMFLFELRKQRMKNELDEKQYQFEKKHYEREISNLNKKMESIEDKLSRREDHEQYKQNIRDALVELQTLSYESFDDLHLTLKRLIEKLVIMPDQSVEIYTFLD